MHERSISRRLARTGLAVLLTVTLLGSASAWAQSNVFPPSGNVGVGTLTPGAGLHIKPATADGLLIEMPTGAAWGLRLQNRTVSTDFSKAFGLFQDNAGVMHFYNGGQPDVLTLDPSANVGIGTATPAARLHVRTGSADGIVVETTAATAGATRTVPTSFGLPRSATLL